MSWGLALFVGLVSTLIAESVTLTCCVSASIFKASFWTVTLSAKTSTSMGSRGAKPASEAVMKYRPGSRCSMAYAPSPPLVVELEKPSLLVTVTVEDGITAPVGSTTVPWMLPVCATAVAGIAARKRSALNVRVKTIRLVIMNPFGAQMKLHLQKTLEPGCARSQWVKLCNKVSRNA